MKYFFYLFFVFNNLQASQFRKLELSEYQITQIQKPKVISFSESEKFKLRNLTENEKVVISSLIDLPYEQFNDGLKVAIEPVEGDLIDVTPSFDEVIKGIMKLFPHAHCDSLLSSYFSAADLAQQPYAKSIVTVSNGSLKKKFIVLYAYHGTSGTAWQ